MIERSLNLGPHQLVLTRNLIYTGMTRAKEECILIGDTEAIGHCVKSAVTDTRKSYLSKRLKLAFDAQVNKKVALAM